MGVIVWDEKAQLLFQKSLKKLKENICYEKRKRAIIRECKLNKHDKRLYDIKMNQPANE